MPLPCLGKLPYHHDPRTLRFARYVSRLPSYPAAFDVTAGKSPVWPMYVNDRLGDCTAAGFGHMVGAWTSAAKPSEVVFQDVEIVSFYSLCSGYDPATGANDNGAVELNVLKKAVSVGIGGHKADAFVAVDPTDPSAQKCATYLFGGLYLGVQLPAYLQDVVASGGDTWDVPSNMHDPRSQPGSWGGHCINAFAYSDCGIFCVSWGQVVMLTWKFMGAYTDESWAVVSKDYIEASGVDPSGFDLRQLDTDLSLVRAA